MDSRKKLHEMLKQYTKYTIYYKPPENLKLTMPCMIYSMIKDIPKYADGKKYLKTQVYEIVIINTKMNDEVVS